MAKGFELRMYDGQNNLIYKELFTSYKTSKDDIERKARQILNNPSSVVYDGRKRPASYKIHAR